jgi:LemA protein
MNRNRWLSAFFILFIALFFSTSCIQKHDRMAEKEIACDEACDEAWAKTEAQYQRRADLIPNLVKVAKASAAHEKETLEAVMHARASATQIRVDPSDAESFAQYQTAQGDVSQALGKLMMVSESYPDLKANEQFATLMSQLEGTENRILIARKKYNAAVADYNKELARAGGKVFNSVTGQMFEPRAMFTAQAGADQAPQVDF